MKSDKIFDFDDLMDTCQEDASPKEKRTGCKHIFRAYTANDFQFEGPGDVGSLLVIVIII